MKSAIRVLLPAWLALLAWGGPAALAGEADPLSARLQAGDPEAVAILEQQFAEAQEAEEKKTIATRLAAAGSASELIVAYLEGHGWEAVRSSRPYPFAFDSDGNLIEPVVYSEEFIAWVEAFAGDLEREARIAAREQPADVVRLEHLEGPRIDAVLLAGIHSPNHAVKVASAKAIARHGHSDAVPSIVAAASAAPAQIRLGIGMLLMVFMDARAEEAARELIGDEETYEELRNFRSAMEQRGHPAGPEAGHDSAAEESSGAPVFVGHPSSTITIAGSDVHFSCEVAGTEPVTFAWQRDGTPLVDGRRVSGSETATLTLYQVEPSDNGRYRCMAVNEKGRTLSAPADLKVVPPAP